MIKMELKEIMHIFCCKCGAFIKSVPSAVAGTSRGGYCSKCFDVMKKVIGFDKAFIIKR